MDITQGNMNGLFRSFRVVFDDALQAAKPRWPEICTESPSGTMEQIFDWLDAIGGMEELIGEVNFEKAKLLDFAIRNKEWQKGVEVRESSIRADQYNAYKPAFQALGSVAAYHPDELLAALLVGGFTTVKDYTGTAFFGVNKPIGNGVTLTNKTTAPLTRDAFRAARARLKSAKNSKGRVMGLGRDLVLITSSKNESTAREILVADTIPMSVAAGSPATATGGGTNVDKGTARPVVWPQLDVVGEDYWFLMDAGFPIKPFVFQALLKPQLNAVNSPGDSHVMKNHTFLYQAYGIYNVGVLFPLLIQGSTGAGN